MASMRMWTWNRRQPTDLFSEANDSCRQIHGTLTTEHAASFYGQPVFVADDGRVYGPAEVPDVLQDTHCPFTAEAAELCRLARLAGYRVESPVNHG